MDIYNVIHNRRSIRKYKPDPIPKEKIIKILEAARVAPSWANKQCWRFVLVEEETRKEKLAAALPEGNPATRAILQAPLVVVLCADPRASGRVNGKEYYLLDAGLAMQQLVLAAWAEGLGTCWVAWTDEDGIRKACNIPGEYRVVALTPVGIPAKEPKPIPRKNLSEIAFKEMWGNSFTA